MDIHSCSHQCVNTPGSYICQCPQGLQLSTDRLNCRQQQQHGAGSEQGKGWLSIDI